MATTENLVLFLSKTGANASRTVFRDKSNASPLTLLFRSFPALVSSDMLFRVDTTSLSLHSPYTNINPINLNKLAYGFADLRSRYGSIPPLSKIAREYTIKSMGVSPFGVSRCWCS